VRLRHFGSRISQTAETAFSALPSTTFINSCAHMLAKGFLMTEAPLASTIVALALIPVAFLFCHAFLSGWRKRRFHPVAGVIAIAWDLTVSIGYMIYRTMGGAVEGATLQVTRAVNAYFMVHVPVAVLVMSLELAVLGGGLWQVRMRATNRWVGRLMGALFFVWWFAFLSGEIFYIVMYML
jgi:hypothetical protein